MTDTSRGTEGPSSSVRCVSRSETFLSTSVTSPTTSFMSLFTGLPGPRSDSESGPSRRTFSRSLTMTPVSHRSESTRRSSTVTYTGAESPTTPSWFWTTSSRWTPSSPVLSSRLPHVKPDPGPETRDPSPGLSRTPFITLKGSLPGSDQPQTVRRTPFKCVSSYIRS